jgi:hypothetical protein
VYIKVHEDDAIGGAIEVKYGCTPLLWAAVKGHAGVIKTWCKY